MYVMISGHNKFIKIEMAIQKKYFSKINQGVFYIHSFFFCFMYLIQSKCRIPKKNHGSHSLLLYMMK